MKDVVFKPVDFSHRGTTYVKHHSRMLGGHKRFTTNTPCPKCGGYQRQHVKNRTNAMEQRINGAMTDIIGGTSFCITCHGVTSRKKYEKASALTVEQRRAIEDHQHRTNDLEDYLL